MEKSSITLLLVEDNPGDTGLIKAYLADEQSQQYKITTASQLSEALHRLETRPFDIILLDPNLPDSHGLTRLKTLMAAAVAIPVIVITGLDDVSLGVEAVRLGAQDYLVKGEFQTGTVAAHRTHLRAFEVPKVYLAPQQAKVNVVGAYRCLYQSEVS